MPHRRPKLFALALALVIAAPAAIAAAGVGHDLRVRLEPGAGTFEAVDRITLDGAHATALGLGSDFVILDLAIDGRTVDVGKGRHRVELTFGAGKHEIAVRYAAEIKPAKGDGTPPSVTAEGSFFPAGTGWVPTLGAEPTRYRIALETPDGQRALVPGRLLEEGVAEGRYRARFEFSGQHQDLVLIAGPYRVTERFHHRIRLRTYFPPELAGHEDVYLTKSAEYLDIYGRRIGPYPYSAFHVAASPLPVGYGFPYLTYVGARVLRLPFIPDTSLRHEMVHEWWGNGVYVDYQSGNWAEGLTTFMADYAFAEEQGAAAARDMRLKWLRDVAALPAGRDEPLRAFTARRHGAGQVIGYDKAAMLFNMLRLEMGGAAFDRALRRFWRDWRGRTAGWRDLRAAFEAEAGRGLAGRFGPWLDRPGVPALRLDRVRVETEAGRFRVRFTLGQTTPAYDLKVPVVVTTAAARSRHFVRLDRAAARFSVTVRAKPAALAVDPDFELLRRLAPGEAPAILRELELARHPAVRIAARGEDAIRAARDLAGKLLEGDPRAEAGDVPLLILGTDSEVAAALAVRGLPAVPAAIAGRGTARAWAGRRSDLTPFAVVSGRDAAALASLIRPLPHYGARSYVVFEGAKAVDTGLWPGGPNPLGVALD